ncbi:MAG: toprim domain-containing protein [Cetobacterium sp.]|uniref:toprim domain-containing protein n=1 Tax=Cetobacterium sp. TaxID=2071632 RepID=UPI003F33F316
MRNDTELNVLMDSLKKRCLQYYNEVSTTPFTGGHICCLSPEHDDRSPSMSYWESGDIFHCFSCGRNVDIFTLAHILEGKPLAGPNFIDDNVFYLAKRFGMEYEHLQREITPEEIKRQQYFRAMKMFADYVVLHKNDEYLSKRKITADTAKKLLIGSVDSLENCIKHLTASGIDKEIIDSIGINRRNVNENKLILIIKDDYGRPNSFVSRETKYFKETLIKGFPGVKEVFESDLYSEERKEKLVEVTGLDIYEINRYISTPKYTNGETTVIFDKSKMFFGWSDIRREYNPAVPLVILEGYIDFVTGYQAGMRNIVAIGSASFTDDHIATIERSRDIKTAAIALDADKTGKKRTEGILDRLLKIKTTKTYKFAVYKNDFKDLDETIIENPEIKKTSEVFELMTIFDFELQTMKRKTDGDFDQDKVFDDFVNIIAKENEPKERAMKSRALAKILTNYDYTTIIEQVNYLINGKEQEFGRDIVSKAELFLKEVKKAPADANKIVEVFKMEIQDIEKSYDKNTKNIFEVSKDYFNEIECRKDEESLFSVNFDIPWFDDLSLQPGNTVIISSLPNTGKSTIFQTIVRKALLKNKNVHIFFATTDDPGPKVYANLIATFSGLGRDYCMNPVYHKRYGIRSEDPNVASYEIREKMHETYQRIKSGLMSYIESKRFVLLDVKKKIDNFKNLAASMKEIGEDQDLDDACKLLILDSANKVTVDGISDENQRAAYISENIKKLSETYGFLSFVNFELNKTKNNARLSQFSLSGSKRMFYDCDVLGFVYNPMRNLQNNTDLFWDKKLDNGVIIKEPILITMQEKSKAGNNEMNNRPYFYKLDTFNNRLETIKVDTPEHNHYERIWEEEFDKKYE